MSLNLRYIPFFFDTPVTKLTTSWLWGNEPLGILPPYINENTAHLLTFKINEDISITLFSSFDCCGGEFDAIDQAHRLLTSDVRIIQGIFHAPLSPEQHSNLPNTLAQAAALPDSMGNTILIDNLENPCEDHKLYGVPYFERKQIEVPLDYIHLVQLTSPGRADRFQPRTWPFTRWYFHLFVRLEPCDYCVCWA